MIASRDRPARAHELRRGLEHGERAPRVAVGLGREQLDGRVVNRQVLVAQPAIGVGQRLPHHRHHVDAAPAA